MSINNKQSSKVCLICGDKANGFHFDAITCESCKSFFRRTALKTKKPLRCYLGGSCQIDVLNRTFCKRCRLDKCFEVGMKSEYIHSRDHRKMNREKGDKTTQSVNNDAVDSTTTGLSSDGNSKDNSSEDVSIEFTATDYSDTEDMHKDMDEIQGRISAANNDTSFTASEAQTSMVPVIITDYSDNFNEVEGRRLTELQYAVQHLKYPSLQLSQTIVDNFFDAKNIFQCNCDQETRKLVKMSKCLTTFATMCESDQLNLLKYASLEIAIMRMIAYFDFDTQYWTVISDNKEANLIPLDLFKGKRRNTYINHKNFLQNMGKEWDSDNTIIDLLTAIILFNPERPNLMHRDIIKFQQHIYMYLLQRYLLLKYRSEIMSKEKFFRLLATLKDLNVLNDKIALNCMEENIDARFPLMREICNRGYL